jgi:3-oxoacyl-[acyl-carrier protein] reductase
MKFRFSQRWKSDEAPPCDYLAAGFGYNSHVTFARENKPEMPGVTGRVALVTGASQGIGRACALALAEAGALIALAARNEEKLASVAKEIEGKGGQAATFRMDVSNESEVKNAVKAVIERFGKIEILVNNAGVTKDTLLMRMKKEEWDTVIQTNLTGAFYTTQAVIGSMLKPRWGRIVNITSVFGQTGQAGQANYAASKAGLIGFTMAMAREVASRNITVNAVAPGYIDTAMTEALSADLKSKVNEMIPLGRAGTDLEVAHAVRFLASEEASYITGHVLKVNGGMLMG